TIVQASAESSDIFMALGIVADPPMLFGKSRIDRYPVRQCASFVCEAPGNTTRHQLTERLENRHRLDTLFVIDAGGWEGYANLGQAEITEQVARYKIWQRVKVLLKVE